MTGWASRARLFMALAALICALQSTAAVGGEELAVDIASLDPHGSGGVIAVVSVVDSSGRPVLGLTNDNFAASVGGTPVSIAEVSAAVDSDASVGVVLAVDVSGSMEGAPLEQARQAARSFVEGLAPADSLALVTFGDDAQPILGFTTDRGLVSAKLDGLQAGGDTALYQATSVSAYVAASAQTQRKAVVLLSDGLDFGDRSAVGREDALAQAASLGVPFFAVGLGSEIDRAYLEYLALSTGGQFLETPTPQGLSDLFGAIGDFLRSQYVVTADLSGAIQDQDQPLALELQVTLGDASGSANEALPPLEVPVEIVEPPAVTVNGLVSGAEIDAPVDLSVEGIADLESATVRVTVDGAVLAEMASPPYRLRLDPSGFPAGDHILGVEVVDATGVAVATELPFVAAVASGGAPSSGLLMVGVVLVLMAALGAVALLVMVRRRPGTEAVATRVGPWAPRRHQQSEPVISLPSEAETELPAPSDEPLGRLVVAVGPHQGEALEIGTRPRRIGSAVYCDLVLTDEEGSIPPEEARVWVSEGRLMYHRLTRLTSFASDGPAGGWLVLQDGEEVRVGPHRLVFELLAKEDSIAEALRQLEERSQEQSSDESRRVSILDVAFRGSEGGPGARELNPGNGTGGEADSD